MKAQENAKKREEMWWNAKKREMQWSREAWESSMQSAQV